jgi:ketosteroid isomerase-like protein
VSRLRRLATDLRELRWGHVLVELVLVIAGILIALAVNDWMEGRKDARAERQYLELLARDLGNDMKVLAQVRDFQDKQAADAAAAYAALASPVAPGDREALANRLSHLSTRRTLRFNPTTYTDLTVTGNVRLIRNRTLRDELAKYYENTERIAAIIERNNQFFVDESYALYLSNDGLIAPRPSNNVASVEASMKGFQARTGMTVTTANDRLWALPADAPEWMILRNKVWLRGTVAQMASQQLVDLGEELTGVRTAVTDELARRWPGGD